MNKIIALLKKIPGLRMSYLFMRMIYILCKTGSIHTILFSPPGHFYSPLPNLKEYSKTTPFTPELLPGINLQKEEQLDLLREFSKYSKELSFPEYPEKNARYYYRNIYFPQTDAMIAACFLRNFRPSRIIEIGSGFSSALMLDINDRFLDKSIQFRFIEPYPKRLYKLLTQEDQEYVKIMEQSVQNVSLDLFGELQNNDILFIDSSHIIRVNSDVAHILFSILPSLNPGVIIHFHDIGWPFEYPREWIKEGRAWNEAYILRSFLQYNNHFSIIYFNAYIEQCHRKERQENLPKCQDKGGSLWIRKK